MKIEISTFDKAAVEGLTVEELKVALQLLEGPTKLRKKEDLKKALLEALSLKPMVRLEYVRETKSWLVVHAKEEGKKVLSHLNLEEVDRVEPSQLRNIIEKLSGEKASKKDVTSTLIQKVKNLLINDPEYYLEFHPDGWKMFKTEAPKNQTKKEKIMAKKTPKKDETIKEKEVKEEVPEATEAPEETTEEAPEATEAPEETTEETEETYDFSVFEGKDNEFLMEALKVLGETVFSEEDGYDPSAMDPDEVRMDLLDNCSLLTKEDKSTILKMESGGEEMWELFSTIHKDLASEEVKKATKEKVKKDPKSAKPKKEKKEKKAEVLRFTRSDAFAEAVRKHPKTVKDLIVESNKIYIAKGGKDNEKESAWMAGYGFKLLTALGLVKISGEVIENIADCITQ